MNRYQHGSLFKQTRKKLYRRLGVQMVRVCFWEADIQEADHWKRFPPAESSRSRKGSPGAPQFDQCRHESTADYM